MNLKERLAEELKEAMRERNEIKLSAIRLALAAVKNAEIDKRQELEDAGVQEIITREVKKRRESIHEFEKGHRPDLVEREKAQMDYLLKYLPKQMSVEEISQIVQKVIAEVGASGPQDIGKVMARVMPQVKGRADGQQVNQIVLGYLSSKK